MVQYAESALATLQGRVAKLKPENTVVVERDILRRRGMDCER